MRRIGSVSSEQQAQSFRDYLFTREIDAQVDQGSDGWNVWILDEDHVDDAREELEQFQAEPQAQKYAAATAQAQARRQARLDEELSARKRQVNMRERWERPIYQRIPVTMLLIVASIAVTVATGFGDNRELRNMFAITQMEFGSNYVQWDGTLPEIRRGEAWRLVTPIFLHFDWMHIIFNMFMLFQFGGIIEEARGKRRFLTMAILIAVVSNFVQYWGPVYQMANWSGLFHDPDQFFTRGPTFGGMSGVVFGLFGYLWMKSRYAPEEGFYMPRQTVVIFAAWTFLCLTGLVGPIANTAHIVGLLTGMVIALAPVMYRSIRGA